MKVDQLMKYLEKVPKKADIRAFDGICYVLDTYKDEYIVFMIEENLISYLMDSEQYEVLSTYYDGPFDIQEFQTTEQEVVSRLNVEFK